MTLFRKKKFWSAVIAGVATALSLYFDNPELGQSFVVLGTALVLGLGLEDLGKARKDA